MTHRGTVYVLLYGDDETLVSAPAVYATLTLAMAAGNQAEGVPMSWESEGDACHAVYGDTLYPVSSALMPFTREDEAAYMVIVQQINSLESMRTSLRKKYAFKGGLVDAVRTAIENELQRSSAENSREEEK